MDSDFKVVSHYDMGPRNGSEPEDVAHRIAQILEHQVLDSTALSAAVKVLESNVGKRVYSQIIHTMAHLSFEPEEAVEHWRGILSLQKEMSHALGESIDVRVALVHYFVNIKRKLNSPKVLEMELYRRTEASVYRDELTGLFNYRYLREHLSRETDLARRRRTPLSVVMLDVDDFKHYNDRNGHLAGNEVLATVAKALQNNVRASDVAIRYGGEEFVVVLSATPKEGAIQVAERIRRAISSHSFAHGSAQPQGRLTVSLGVATFPADASNPTELIRKADSAMYLVKSTSKGSVCGYGQSLRSYRRIPANIDGRFFEIAGNHHDCRTVNVGEGGLLLWTKHHVQVDALLNLHLSLSDDIDLPLTCMGRVLRVVPDDSSGYHAAVRILDMSATDGQRLDRFMKSAA